MSNDEKSMQWDGTIYSEDVTELMGKAIEKYIDSLTPEQKEELIKESQSHTNTSTGKA